MYILYKSNEEKGKEINVDLEKKICPTSPPIVRSTS